MQDLGKIPERVRSVFHVKEVLDKHEHTPHISAHTQLRTWP